MGRNIQDIIDAMRDREAAYAIPRNYIPEWMDDISVESLTSWRATMVDWFFQIAETFDFKMQTIEITMSILDRYVAANTDLMNDGDKYQLAALTALYTAAKIHEECCLTPYHIQEISQGKFSYETIVKEEEKILFAVKWLVNPPTAVTFARILLSLIPSAFLPRKQKRAVMQLVQQQIDLTLYEDVFVPTKPSTVAVAALFNGLAGVSGGTKLPSFLKHRILSALDLDKSSWHSVSTVRKVLCNLAFKEEEEEEEEETEPEMPTKLQDISGSRPEIRVESSPRTIVARAC